MGQRNSVWTQPCGRHGNGRNQVTSGIAQQRDDTEAQGSFDDAE